MTLPPDTDEYRSLRNWYCFKLNQFKKGTLGAKNEALLAHYGLDFSQYEALNTGRGERESDRPCIQALKQIKLATGSYALNDDAPAHLVAWQDRLLHRFEEDGLSRRMKEMLRELPGLHLGLWMRPRDLPPSVHERDWWNKATQYEVLAERFPAHAGVQHPGMPASMHDWARHQQTLAARQELPKRASGWMRGIGLQVNAVRQRVGAARLKASLDMRGGESSLNQYAANDRRLSSIRGAIGAIHAVQQGRDDHALMVEFNIDPPTAVALRKHITKRAGAVRWHKPDITGCRMIALNFSNAFTPQFWRVIEDFPQSRPAGMTPAMQSLGRLAWSVTQAFGERTIKTPLELPEHGATVATGGAMRSHMVIEPRGDAPPLFKHIAQEWLDENRAQWTVLSHKSLTSIVHKWLLPELGELPIASLRETDVCDHIDGLGDVISQTWRPLSASSIANISSALNGILQSGLSRHGLPPMDRSKLPQLTVSAREAAIDPFTKSEALLLLGLVREDFSNFLHASIYSGLMGIEVVDLLWDSIDFKHMRIQLDRTVEIDDSWGHTLLNQFQHTGAQRGYVFTSTAGTQLNQKNLILRVWLPLLRHAGLRRRAARQLRHTAVMFWMDSGKTDGWIAAQLGLASAATVARRYRPLLQRFREGTATAPTTASGDPLPRMLAPALRGMHHPQNRTGAPLAV